MNTCLALSPSTKRQPRRRGSAGKAGAGRQDQAGLPRTHLGCLGSARVRGSAPGARHLSHASDTQDPRPPRADGRAGGDSYAGARRAEPSGAAARRAAGLNLPPPSPPPRRTGAAGAGSRAAAGPVRGRDRRGPSGEERRGSGGAVRVRGLALRSLRAAGGGGQTWFP